MEFIRRVQKSEVVHSLNHFYPLLRTHFGSEYKDLDSGEYKIVWTNKHEEEVAYLIKE